MAMHEYIPSYPPSPVARKRYRIHYPGWDSNWDEWVVRDRLRWPVDPSYLSTVFKVRDVVEVWCTGTHVKGAWLQARVKQVSERCATKGAKRRQQAGEGQLEAYDIAVFFLFFCHSVIMPGFRRVCSIYGGVERIRGGIIGLFLRLHRDCKTPRALRPRCSAIFV